MKAFEDAKDDDPRVRQYLALAIGRLDPPLPREAVPGAEPKRSTIRDGEARISAIWALGVLGRRGVVPRCSRSTQSPDAAFARWWFTRSARCRATRRSKTLRTALQDAAPDVRWNAAVALARKATTKGCR